MKVGYSIRIERKILDEIKVEAQIENRSINNMIEQAIDNYSKQKKTERANKK